MITEMRCGRPDIAQKHFETAERLDIADAKSYATRVTINNKLGKKISSTRAIFQKGKHVVKHLDPAFYNIMLQLKGKHNGLANAIRIFNEAEKDNYVDANSFSHIMHIAWQYN
jgi:hypothetical protein